MKTSHIHLTYTDLKKAIQWMKNILDKEPIFENAGMALFAFENIDYVFDLGESDTEVTIAMHSTDCEKDFQSLIDKGAEIIEGPEEQPWGVKTAYIQGPGKVIFEIEQRLG